MIELVIPHRYPLLTIKDREKICNGCGSKGGIDVPDTMYFLSVTEACDIHDFMWHEAKALEDLEYANEVFHSNMKIIIKRGSWWLRGLRYSRAHKYYLAVKYVGTSAYTKERNL